MTSNFRLHSPVRDGAASLCIACYVPTDTVLSLHGSVEWALGTLVAIGVPLTEALNTIQVAFDGFPAGRRPWHFACCQPCADKAHMTAHLSTGQGLAYREPPSDDSGSIPKGTHIDPGSN